LSGDVVIRAEGLGKSYLISHAGAERERYVALRDVLAGAARGAVGRIRHRARGPTLSSGESIEEFWALKDVSFEVKRGEVLGIVGRNGAGKSTLLKVLSRITEPTRGRVEIRGRLASLLEVGTGFHPELTGRENIFLNSAILGMTRAEIRGKFDEIVAFAEVDNFLDTPVKRYSSGMYVRLAFAIAAHLEPEILVVDEVLAVGDAEFQKKCLGKMQDVAGHGRTVLFVSHNIGAVNALCSKCMLLHSGRKRIFGDVRSATEAYLTAAIEHGYSVEFSKQDASSGNSAVAVRGARIRLESGQVSGCVAIGEGVWIEIDYDILQSNPLPRLNLHLIAEDGVHAFASFENTATPRGIGRFSARMWIPPNFLNAMRYHISIYFTSVRPAHLHFALKDVLTLQVVDDIDAIARQGYEGSFPGVLRPVMEWIVDVR